jgi:two-component system, OmpR family, phosphate regulon sensor histidine kinase PhoR
MTTGRFIPITGIVLAVVTSAVLAIGGANILFVLAAMVVWIASLWLTSQPPPPASPNPVKGNRLTPASIRDLIEHSGMPMFMLEGDRIAVANAAARETMGGHVVGQDARVAFRHPVAVDLLARPDGGSALIAGLTGPRSVWQMTRQRIDATHSLIELHNRTTEADIGRAHTDFVANASHELRTPLASIIGYMETLVEAGGDLDKERANRFHGTVLQEARRLQSLVDDLMSLSRIEAEKHDQPREELDFAGLVEQASRDGAGPDRRNRLEILPPAEKLSVRGDRKQLEQLVCNLVDNALKYGAPDSSVRVGLELGENRTALLTVRDLGEGIAAEHIPHLTRRFYRTDPGRSRAAGGTGLGLAIVKHIVERHRGRLDIASRKGEGTTVTVALPLAD